MILYLDTSAYVRCYIREERHREVLRAVHDSELVATHLIAYAEMLAAFAKMVRMGRLGSEDHAALRERLDEDWPRLVHVGVHERLVRRAGALAERYELRGYDAVHLAAAESLATAMPETPLQFGCFDTRLNAAAGDLGLPVFPAVEPS